MAQNSSGAKQDSPFNLIVFPKPDSSGVVAVTDFLNTDIVYSGYVQGIFPWFNEDEGEAVVWWSPDPRFVLLPENIHVSSRLKRFIRHSPYKYTFDKDFDGVIEGCRTVKRPGQDGTWIGPSMIKTYKQLHRLGIAHSVEVWHEDALVGGFYGVLIGQVFFGESMFSLMSNTATSALGVFFDVFFSCGGRMIDSQVYTDNIARFGGKNISRTAFLRLEKDMLFSPLSEEVKDAFEKHPAVCKRL